MTNVPDMATVADLAKMQLKGDADKRILEIQAQHAQALERIQSEWADGIEAKKAPLTEVAEAGNALLTSGNELAEIFANSLPAVHQALSRSSHP